MKESLIISFLVLAFLYAVEAQEDCIRVVTNAPVKVRVGWCSEEVSASIPNGIGYCTNARCKSTHKTHLVPEQVVRGK